jgi:cytoskeletal protein RodZ
VGSFGDRLRHERERRKISLNDVALSTKIGTRFLQALEEEKFDQLPGGIFNKSFVRAYARHIGIDEDQAVVEYLEASGENQAFEQPLPEETIRRAIAGEEPRSSVQNDKPRPRVVSMALPWEILAVALVLVAIVFATWNFVRREPHEKGRTVGQVHSESFGIGESRSTDSGNRRFAAAPGWFTLEIRANDDSWVAINSDGKTLFSDTLIAPSERVIRAQKELVVQAANINALTFSFNGKEVATPGGAAQVKNLAFGPHGLESPH